MGLLFRLMTFERFECDMAREIGRLSDEWTGRWVVLNCGLIGEIVAFPEGHIYKWRVCGRRDLLLTDLGEYFAGDSHHQSSVNWDATANITTHLLELLSKLHPHSAPLLAPFSDHVKEHAHLE